MAVTDELALGQVPLRSFKTALPGPRRWLRARPRLQGAVVAALGPAPPLPHAADELHAVLYHGVDAGQQQRGLRRHLQTMLDRGRFLSWDESLAALQSDTPLPGPHFCLSFDDGHKEWVDRVLPLLQEQSISATFFLATDQVVEGDSDTALTWADCKELVAAGMSIGSHSASHRRMNELSLEDVRREAVGSKQVIEDRLGVEVLDFAFPFGLPGVDYGMREIEVVQEAGYRSGASALPGAMRPGHSVWDLRRCGLSPAWPLHAVRRRVHE